MPMNKEMLYEVFLVQKSCDVLVKFRFMYIKNMIKNIFWNFALIQYFLVGAHYENGNIYKRTSLYLEIKYLTFNNFLKDWEKINLEAGTLDMVPMTIFV